MDPQDQPGSAATPPWRGLWVLWLVAVLVGSYARIDGLWNHGLEGDEEIALARVESGYGPLLTTFDRRGSHIAFPLLQRVSLDLFGSNVVSYRLPALLAGLLTLGLLLPLGRRLVGAGPACLATAFLAVHPMHIYYSREGRPYALMVLVGFLLLVALERALAGRRTAWIAVAVSAGLLPWIHLSAAGTVALLGLISLAFCLRGGPDWRLPLGAFAGAALLCFLLYLPALEGLLGYWERLNGHTRARPMDPLEVARAVAGTTGAAWALALGGVLGGVWLLRAAPSTALLLLAATLSPILALCISQPSGLAWAYARYLLVAIVPLTLLAARGWFQSLRVLTRHDSLAFAVPFLFLIYYAATGPFRLDEVRKPLANTQWVTLFERPMVDVPYGKTPALYRELAKSHVPLVVVEYPYYSAAVPLLRNYARQHGQTTWLGRFDARGVRAHRPYFPLDRSKAPGPEVDWVIVHLDLAEEAADYHGSAYLSYHPEVIPPLGEHVERMRATWGPPTYEDELILAWHTGER